MAANRFSWGNFAIRWVVAMVAVMATFNPTSMSYYQWVMTGGNEDMALKVLAGLVLLILIVIYLRATWNSLGPIGVVLATAFLGACVWALVDLGLLDLANTTVVTWIALAAIATVMAIGISWSHIRRRVSGQLDVDETEL
ncbi:MAG: DUF6524 family protein [Alphaproteobacteria bacterium]|jgi:hypothetical protein|nr:hypothetical protein [Rhodospirillaceae bacterium]MDG2481364.1 DUF6524 family protein [Alphaproteobacteria bacterium]MBT6205561.1 hypothetical protein [Rhodospirillaceae bacterium]MBT6511724.1 hypothetical protein [Rhodospirillaceae bacterium]MBT7614393.1 hypothetical protein [Rhodospirillaceae bacterium]